MAPLGQTTRNPGSYRSSCRFRRLNCRTNRRSHRNDSLNAVNWVYAVALLENTLPQRSHAIRNDKMKDRLPVRLAQPRVIQTNPPVTRPQRISQNHHAGVPARHGTAVAKTSTLPPTDPASRGTPGVFDLLKKNFV